MITLPNRTWFSNRQLCVPVILIILLISLTSCRSNSSISTRQLSAANLFSNQSTALTFDYYLDEIRQNDTMPDQAGKNKLAKPERQPLRRLHIHGRAHVNDTTAATFSENMSSFQNKTSERAGAVESHFHISVVLAMAFLFVTAIAIILLRLYFWSSKRSQ